METHHGSKPLPSVLPDPPYYAVVFAAVRSIADPEYDKTLGRMIELIQQQDGFLGADAVQPGPGHLGLTVAYFRDAECITAWRDDPEHKVAQAEGKERWYDSYAIHIARVERAYRFDRDETT